MVVVSLAQGQLQQYRRTESLGQVAASRSRRLEEQALILVIAERNSRLPTERASVTITVQGNGMTLLLTKRLMINLFGHDWYRDTGYAVEDGDRWQCKQDERCNS